MCANRAVWVACIVFSFVLVGIAQSKLQTISIQDPRPVAELVWNLEKRYGVAINYEDPPYLFAGDLEDVAQKVRKERKEVPLLIPRERTIDFETLAGNKHDLVSFEAALERTLLRYADQTGFVFSVRRNKEILTIVPANFRNEKGEFRPYGPVLDRRITITPKHRKGLEYLKDVCQALSDKTGSRVVTATIPLNLLASVWIDASVQELPARDALALLFTSTGRNLTWQLLYDPDDGTYLLNIREVPRPVNSDRSSGSN